MKTNRTLVAAFASTGLLALTACGGAGPSAGAPDGGGFTDDKVVLAVLNDASGVYKDVSGPNSVKAVEMALADFKAEYGDDAVVDDITVVSADHQNKPDVANTQAQRLYDREGADVILDVPTSSAALAVAALAKEKKKLHINVSAGTTELTGAQCNRYTFHWDYDTEMLARGTGTMLTKAGDKDWQIIYPDYAFGADMDRSFTNAIEAAGGTVSGHIKTPFPNENFATFITKASSEDPDAIASMHAGGDLVNFVKQFNQAGLQDSGIQLAVGLMNLADIHALGVEAFKGVNYTEPWYWNFDDKTRAWTEGFVETTGTYPSSAHAANYSAALQYLQAIQAVGTDDADTVVANLDGKQVDDVFLRNGTIRAEDHRVIHDTYLARVKAPADVKKDWDYIEIEKVVPAEDAFRSVEESKAAGCVMG